MIGIAVAVLITTSFAVNSIASVADSTAKQSESYDPDLNLYLPVGQKMLGDFDEIKDRRVLRIIVPYSKTTYFMDGPHQMGTAVDVGHELESWLAKRHKFDDKALKIAVTFIPTPRENILQALKDGYGDLAAGNLTVTQERLKKVDFTTPLIANVKEIAVTGPGGLQISSFEDLLGKEVYVRRSSSYLEHKSSLNKKLKKSKRPPIKIKVADENLEDEDILEMVNAGVVPLTIVDDHIAKFWSQILDSINLHENAFVNEGGKIAWAVRPNCPKLMAEIDEFAKDHGPNSAFAKEVLRKYLRNTKFVTNATSKKEMKKFSELIKFFKQYASQYDFDTLMLIAMGYQESKLNQGARSPSGAVGVMQVLPSTAASPKIGIIGVDKSAEKNIHAATKYLRLLVETYLNDPKISPMDRTLMVFAAYNAGPGSLIKFRSLAKQSGLNPNIWFNNVELAAARIVGRETVQYVSNIYKYYVSYKLVLERMKARGEVPT